jgi:hypothetical protein
MVYSTQVVNSFDLAEEAPAKLDALLAGMARNRSMVLREKARNNPAHIGPMPSERSYGDCVIVMVDPGKGEQVSKEILEQMKTVYASGPRADQSSSLRRGSSEA